MIRWVCLAAVMLAVSSSAAADTINDAFDYTCTDSGTRHRITVVEDVKGQPLPCKVETFKHPLGSYSMEWRTLWQAEHDVSFCQSKVQETVEKLREAGAKCMTTKRYQGRE